MNFVFNPDAEEFAPKAEEEHRHSGERNGCAWGKEKLGITWVSKHPTARTRVSGLGWAGTAEPSHWKRRREYEKKKTEGSDQASAGKVCST